MMRLIHFSDPHVQLPDWRRRSLRALGPLRALATAELWKGRGRLFEGAADSLRGLAAESRDYDHAICTGDLTQLGHAEEFALAREALGGLAADPARFTTLPGNHDRYPWNGRASREFEQRFPEHLASDLPAGPLRVRLLGGEVALVILDTAGAISWPVISKGEVQPDALEALGYALALPALASRCKLVLIHHAPLRRNGRTDFPFHSLRGYRALLRACQRAGVEAILCGHLHERYSLAPTAERPRVICAGSATERGKEGYWDLRIEGGRLVSHTARLPGGAIDPSVRPG